jgi:hypothetical protein
MPPYLGSTRKQSACCLHTSLTLRPREIERRQTIRLYGVTINPITEEPGAVATATRSGAYAVVHCRQRAILQFGF